MKRFLIAGALSVLVAVGAVFAQQIVVPQVATVTPSQDLVQIVPKGQPSAQALYAPTAAISSSEQYAKVTLTGLPNNSYTQTFANFQSDLLLLASGTISYFYFTFAPNPSDGARECIYANQTVTTAYPTANTTLVTEVVNSNNTITSMTASTRYCFLYSASNLTWDRD